MVIRLLLVASRYSMVPCSSVLGEACGVALASPAGAVLERMEMSPAGLEPVALGPGGRVQEPGSPAGPPCC